MVVKDLKYRQGSPEVRTTYGVHRITVFNKTEDVILNYKETLQNRCRIEFKRGFIELYSKYIQEK